MLNILAKFISVPVARIVKLNSNSMEIFCTNASDKNPYKVGAKRSLESLFCSNVVENKEKFSVAELNGFQNTDTELGMISYLGFPLFTPDMEIFGTISILDTKKNKFRKDQEKLVLHFKESIENYLKVLYRNHELESEKRNLKCTLENIDDGVLFHSKDRIITVFNPAAERITGLEAKDVLGKDCYKVFPFRFCGGNCSFCEGDADFKEIKIYETDIPFKNGKKTLKVNVTPLEDQEGKLFSVIVSFQEVSVCLDQKKIPKTESSFSGIIGQNHKMLDLYETIAEVGQADVPVSLFGESGTGKEIVAKAIHDNSKRRSNPFIAINCGAFAQGIIDSELFGHVKGAFTGALKNKKGCFERADQGTLFLDEVAELPKETQVKLLRVLQEGVFEAVGGEKTRKVNIRIISATNRNLQLMLENGEFREDLYYRLVVFPIILPPLRDRIDDIPLLVEYFLHIFSKKLSFPHASISPEAIQVFKEYRWPGNVRQLQNAIHYALIKSRGKKILPENLPPEISQVYPLRINKTVGRKPKLNLQEVMSTLKRVDGNKAKCAKMLGVARATLYNFLKKEKLDIDF